MWTIGRAKIEDSRPKSTGDHPSKLEFQSLGQGTKPDMTATVKNKHTNIYLRFLRLPVQRHLRLQVPRHTRTHTSELHEHTWLYTLLGCHENDTEDHNLQLFQLVFKTHPQFLMGTTESVTMRSWMLQGDGCGRCMVTDSCRRLRAHLRH